MFHRGIDHAATQVKSLADASLLGIGIGGERHFPRCPAALGVYLDDAVAQVSVFYRWDAGNDFHAGDIGRTDGACTGTRRLVQVGIILEPLPVNLDGGAEGGIAFLARCCTQGDALIVDERTVYGLATGHEGQDVTHVDNLLVV